MTIQMQLHIKPSEQNFFSPSIEDNKQTIETLTKLVVVAATYFINELESKSRVTYRYLSILGDPFSWEYCPDKDKEPILGLKATIN